MKVNLFFNHYQDESVQRQFELDACLKKNREVFDNVILVPGRPTFAELFELTKDYPDDINCFCNSDIYFTDISMMPVLKENECWALCRYNMNDNVIKFFNRFDAQDSWVFRGTVKNVEANFVPGKFGCDNRLAYELEKAGYKVTNPSLSVKTIHLHAKDTKSHKRTTENTIPPPYLVLEPTYLP
jgi:hypothetical protein